MNATKAGTKRSPPRAKSAKATPRATAEQKIILVGTYKGDQLKKWPGWYCWPLDAEEPRAKSAKSAKVGRDSPTARPQGQANTPGEPQGLRRVTELWLFQGTKAQKTYKAEFVGVKTRAELVRDYGYPATGKAHGSRYALFRTELLYRHKNAPQEEAAAVIVRTKDFAKRSPKISKQLKAYLESPDRNDPDLAKLLPAIVTSIPPAQLRVCEAAIQLQFLDILFPGQIFHADLEPQWRMKQVIDLFAGCGGLSLGFEMAGFNPILAIEKDAWASETYSRNRDNANVITCDITQITDPEKSFPDAKGIFGIIGGPPCQGFSVSGGRDPKDPRNSLFMEYMRFVKALHPAFFVLENVPGILSSVTKSGESVKEVIMAVARKIGYNVQQILLDAAQFGVPQSRQRVFFIGIRNDYPFDPKFLMPKPLNSSKPVTLWEAISDLPRIEAGEGAETMSYTEMPTNPYQTWCRANSNNVRNHVAMRHTKRLVARFHVIQYGQSAADVPPEHMQRKRGDASTISGKIYSQNNMKPFPDKPSPTVPASFQSNFVHPYIDRNFTAREGARLQSFPDSYVFYGRRTTMSWEKNLSQYQQIGNAVPPLLAKSIATMIDNYFSHISDIKDHSKEQE